MRYCAEHLFKGLQASWELEVQVEKFVALLFVVICILVSGAVARYINWLIDSTPPLA